MSSTDNVRNSRRLRGMTPYEAVQTVYFKQEKVLLDFQPADDKYKEVVMDINTAVREFMVEEPWSWLRDRVVLGDIFPQPHEQIPEFRLPPYATMVSTLHGDGCRLHRPLHPHMYHHGCEDEWILPDETHYIYVPWASKGVATYTDRKAYNTVGFPGTMDIDLRAIQLGDVITFDRPLFRRDFYYPIVTCDVQKALELIDINNLTDEYRDHVMWEEVPVPGIEYILTKAAMYHSYGSPVASGRAMDLNDQAQKILSTLRDNDSAKTYPDTIYSPQLNYIEV